MTHVDTLLSCYSGILGAGGHLGCRILNIHWCLEVLSWFNSWPWHIVGLIIILVSSYISVMPCVIVFGQCVVGHPCMFSLCSASKNIFGSWNIFVDCYIDFIL